MRDPFDEDDSDNGNELSSVVNPSNINLSNIDYGFADIGANLGADTNFGKFDIASLLGNPELLKAFATLYPEDAALLENIKLPSEGGKEYVSQNPSGLTEPPSTTDPLDRFEEDTSVFDKSKNAESTGIKKILEDLKKGFKGVTGLDAGDAAKYAAIIAAMKMAYDDAERARKEAKGTPFKSSSGYKTVTGPGGVTGFKKAAKGGVMSLIEDKNDPLATVNLFDPSVFQTQGQKVSKGPYATQNQQSGYDTPYAIDELNAFKSFARGMGYDPYEFMQQTEGAPQYNVPVSLFNLYMQSRKAAAPQGTLGMTGSQLESSLKQAGEKAGPDYFAQEQARRQQKAINADALIPRPSGIGGSPPLELFGAEYEAARQKSINDYLAQQKKARNDPLTVRTVSDPSDPFTSRSETTEERLRRGLDPTGSSQQRSGETPAKFYNTADYMEVDGKLVPRPGSGAPPINAAEGGIMSLGMAQGRYLGGHSDGMADKVPANIDGRRPAALSDGEFVVPADVVSHLGNGNSNAGAKRLYEMMDRIRGARTGNTKQGKQINPNKFLPR